MLFLNQANSTSSGNISCSSFSIRRSPRVQPNSDDHAAGSGEGKCNPSSSTTVCEKNNTSFNSEETTGAGKHGDDMASAMEKKNPPLPRQPNLPAAAIVSHAIASIGPATANESGTWRRPSIRNENLSVTKPPKESSELSCEDLTESSYDAGDVPDLVEEDIFLDHANTRRLPVRPQFRSSIIDYQESPSLPLMPFANDCKQQQSIVIKSSLRVSKRSSHRGRPPTERRVHGLWSCTINNDCHWYKLRDETVVHILGFLNLAERLKVGMLANRYRSLVHADKTLWVAVDATEFVHTAHANFLVSSKSLSDAQALTGKALEDILQRYNPVTLTIRDIYDRLSANSYLPNVASLQELTLTHFHDLSDTHVHVLLLISQAGAKKKPNTLRRLSLNHCPLLTHASLRSVASQCAFLESLKLQGCTGIAHLDSLANLLTTETKQVSSYATNHNHQAASIPTSSLLNMFAPPPSMSLAPKPSSQLSDMFAPSTTKPATGPSKASIFSQNMFAPPTGSQLDTSSIQLQSPTPPTSSPRSRSKARTSSNPLQSLFAPPGMSPGRKGAAASGNYMATPSSSSSSSSLPSSSSSSSLPSSSSSSSLPSSKAPLPQQSCALGGHHVFGGKLQEIDLRGTAVHPTALLKLFLTASDDNTLQVSLRGLWLDGNQWRDQHLDQLGNMLVAKDLAVLSLACANALLPKSGYMTDKTLYQWAERMRFSQLCELNLSGHRHITGLGLADFLQQTPKLESLSCRKAIHISFSSSSSSSSSSGVANMMKRLASLRKKQSLRFVDLRDCQLDAQSLSLVQSHLLNGSSPVTVLL